MKIVINLMAMLKCKSSVFVYDSSAYCLINLQIAVYTQQ